MEIAASNNCVLDFKLLWWLKEHGRPKINLFIVIGTEGCGAFCESSFFISPDCALITDY